VLVFLPICTYHTPIVAQVDSSTTWAVLELREAFAERVARAEVSPVDSQRVNVSMRFEKSEDCATVMRVVSESTLR
jgi:hypothetical protein